MMPMMGSRLHEMITPPPLIQDFARDAKLCIRLSLVCGLRLARKAILAGRLCGCPIIAPAIEKFIGDSSMKDGLELGSVFYG